MFTTIFLACNKKGKEYSDEIEPMNLNLISNSYQGYGTLLGIAGNLHNFCLDSFAYRMNRSPVTDSASYEADLKNWIEGIMLADGINTYVDGFANSTKYGQGISVIRDIKHDLRNGLPY